MSEQGKPEPWMLDADDEIRRDLTAQLRECKIRWKSDGRWVQIIARHYVASQPLVPQPGDEYRKVLRDEILEEVRNDPTNTLFGMPLPDVYRLVLAERTKSSPITFHSLEPLVPQQEPTRKLGDTCIHCGSLIERQPRYEGWECCCQGYWFSGTTGSACPKSEFGHERAGVPSEQGTPPQGTWEKKWERIDSAARVYRHSVHSSVCNCAACIVLLKALVGD